MFPVKRHDRLLLSDCPMGLTGRLLLPSLSLTQATWQCDSCWETLHRKQLMPQVEQAHIRVILIMWSCVCVCVCVCVWRSSGSTAWVMCSYPVGAKHPKNVREKSDHQSTCSQISRVQGWLYRTGLLKQEYVTSCSKIVGCGVSSQAAKPKRQYLTI